MNDTELKVVGGTDIDRGWAFRPSVLKSEGIEVEFRRDPQRRFNWRKLQWCVGFFVYEVWIEPDDNEFKPGNGWFEWA